MNYSLIFRYLSVVSSLVGVSMLFSLPWTCSFFGGHWEQEQPAFFGLLAAALISFAMGFLLRYLGKKSNDDSFLLRKEAIVVVGLSWVLATLLGALPYLFSQTERNFGVPMSFADAIFETQSGLSTTGASVIAELDDPKVVPRSILFWRSTTNFLGGVGIMALFVVLFGHGASGKAVLRMEQTKMSSTSPQTKIRQTAFSLLYLYLGLNLALIVLLLLEGVTFFDAICHSFATIATGGFSTHNLSIGHFAAKTTLNGPFIEWTIIVFMFLAGTNFVLLYWCCMGQPTKMFKDIEWRTYLTIVFGASLFILTYGWFYGDFTGPKDQSTIWLLMDSLRASVFHVVSIVTTTGFATRQFELWNGLSLLIFVFLMLVGACSGSTCGGTKIIRWVITYKAFGQELERFWRPHVVRSLKLGERELEKETVSSVIGFLLLYGVSILLTAFLVLMIEPNETWLGAGKTQAAKIFDVLSASLAMFSNIGPGFGVVGAQENYSHFTEPTKIIFTWAMLLGRLELFVILTMFVPSFWRNR